MKISKGFKIWLWFALVLSVLTTAMNGYFGRWLSVAVAVVAICGLCVLLFAKKRWGFALMCVCYLAAFGIGVWQGVAGQTGIVSAIAMSFVGSVFIPGVTYLFLHRQPR